MRKQEPTQEQFERIESYLLHNMNLEDRLAFEKELEEDEFLRGELKIQQTLLGIVESNSLRSDRSRIPETPVIMLKKEAPAVPIRKWFMAAAILLVVATGAFYFFFPPSSRKLFADYFRPDPGLPVTMSPTNDFTFNEAMTQYKREEYEKAIQNWKSLLSTPKNTDTLQYFLGMAFLNSGQSDSAIVYLAPITSHPASVFQESAIWYYALALLKQGKKGEAITELGKIPQDPDAARLLRSLKK